MECAIPPNAPKNAEKRVVAVYPNGAVRPAVGHAWRNVVCRNVLVQLTLQFDVFATFLCCNLACRMLQLYIRNVACRGRSFATATLQSARGWFAKGDENLEQVGEKLGEQKVSASHC